MRSPVHTMSRGDDEVQDLESQRTVNAAGGEMLAAWLEHGREEGRE
jgi:hypothetical protein